MRKESHFSRAPFDTIPGGREVEVFTLVNDLGMEVRAMSYGATILSIKVPDARGTFDDVVLGYDSLAGYLKDSPYFGAAVGRFANRIAKGRFTLDGKQYTLAVNNGPNALHGGLRGFDKKIWSADRVSSDSGIGIAFTLVSPDGDEGYPGTLTVRVTYTLMRTRNELVIDYEGATDKPTPVNLTNHSYFNLAGAGKGDILGHQLTLESDSITPVDATLIPTGAVTSVTGTPFDFRTATAIGARIDADDEQIRHGHGYDHNFVIRRKAPGLQHVAHVVEPVSGRTLDLSTTEPGVQFYTGNFLDGSNVGKGGTPYPRRGAFCLETQHYPDSPNHANFPSTILRPGDIYRSRTVYSFGIVK
ncbi:MAG: aldose epimerase family protein [Gemmatimonadota bacterium]